MATTSPDCGIVEVRVVASELIQLPAGKYEIVEGVCLKPNREDWRLLRRSVLFQSSPILSFKS